MDNFIASLKNHIDHVKRVGAHCATEETTKQALVPLQMDVNGDSLQI